MTATQFTLRLLTDDRSWPIGGKHTTAQAASKQARTEMAARGFRYVPATRRYERIVQQLVVGGTVMTTQYGWIQRTTHGYTLVLGDVTTEIKEAA